MGVKRVPGGVTIGVGVVNTSLAGDPIMVGILTQGTRSGKLLLLKVGIRFQWLVGLETSSYS